MNSTRMTDAQVDQTVRESYDLAYAHMERGDYAAAYSVAQRLRDIGLEQVADNLSETIFCVQHDC